MEGGEKAMKLWYPNRKQWCSGRIAETDGAFSQAQQEKQKLITRIGTRVPLKTLLEELTAMATELTKRASAA